MATKKYGQFVFINEEKGMIQWHEHINMEIIDTLAAQGCKLYDTNTADPQEVEAALHRARHNMGIE